MKDAWELTVERCFRAVDERCRYIVEKLNEIDKSRWRQVDANTDMVKAVMNLTDRVHAAEKRICELEVKIEQSREAARA